MLFGGILEKWNPWKFLCGQCWADPLYINAAVLQVELHLGRRLTCGEDRSPRGDIQVQGRAEGEGPKPRGGGGEQQNQQQVQEGWR